MEYNISKYDNSHPIVKFVIVDDAIIGKSMKMPSVRWGDVSFSFISLENMQDVDTWIHEFTEDTIADLIQGQEGVEISTIAQIVGIASGVVVHYDGWEFFAFLHHLLTSLSCSSLIPTLNGFIVLDPDEFWNVLMGDKK